MLLFLIPTAKELAEINPRNNIKATSPTTEKITEELSQKSIEELQTLYHFKKREAAEKEYQRWQNIKLNHHPSYTALDLFHGLMYRSIKNGLSDKARKYLNNHVFITTSLYGIIPANEPIAAHRLDFATKLTIHNKTLKTIWQDHYDQFLEEHPKEHIISLLSSEFETVFSANFRKKLITVNFYEKNQQGEFKQHSTISKKGRGYFLKAVAEQHIDTLEKLKSLTFEGYSYLPSEETNVLNYIRNI